METQRVYSGEERRLSCPMLNKEDVKEVIHDAFEFHMLSDQHQFVKVLMDKERRKQEIWDKVKVGILSSLGISGVMYFLTIFWVDIKRILGY